MHTLMKTWQRVHSHSKYPVGAEPELDALRAYIDKNLAKGFICHSKSSIKAEPELDALCAYIDENLAKGFIRHSKPPTRVAILFLKKKNVSLCLCVDYRALNSVMICNHYHLPLISELLDSLRTRRVFSNIDLRGAYNLVRIRLGDECHLA